MSAWNSARWIVLGCLASSWGVFSLGCGMEATTSSSAGSGGGYAGGGYGGAPAAGGSSSSSSGGPSSGQVMLVVVDSNRTMTASAGDGVGVFTEYQTGGHWHVWWTCDTNKTNLSCAFDVSVAVPSGTIANASAQVANGNGLTPISAQTFDVTSTTASNVDGVTFDTVVDAGQTPFITVDAKLNGVEDPTFLFFVQDGQVNGNYTGSLSDPLMFEPSSP